VEDSGKRETVVGFGLCSSLSKTNLPDLSERDWHEAYEQRVTTTRDVSCVSDVTP